MDRVSIGSKLLEIEGLRALLAYWVVCSHFLSENGIKKEMVSGPLLLLRNGYLAVCVFMILSGFVIALTLHKKHESYPVFITRRFFRLFPVHFFAICFAALLSLVVLKLKKVGILPTIFSSLGGHFKNEWPRFTEYFLSHAAMVHGLIPLDYLPRSYEALVVPAWSISVEWQFYLIAPLLVLAITKYNKYIAQVLLALIVGVAVYYINDLKKIFSIGVLFIHLQWFILGIICYQLFANTAAREMIGRLNILAISLVLIFILAPGFSRIWDGIVAPLIMWAAFYISLCKWHSSDTQNLEGQKVRKLLLSSTIQKVGQASYSIYLIHWPLLGLILAIFSTKYVLLDKQLELVIAFVIAILLSYLVGRLLYNAIEVRGIKFGSKLAAKLIKKSNV